MAKHFVPLFGSLCVAFVMLAFSSAVEAQALDTGVVKITSAPSGAHVYSSGSVHGVTPVFVELSVGRHQLIITKDGYAPYVRNVSVRKNRITRMDVNLKNRPGETIRVHEYEDGAQDAGPGSVQIVTHPPGLRVFMNDLLVPQPTPVVFDIAAGNYELRLEYQGTTVLRRTVFVRTGKTLDLNLPVKRRRTIDDKDPWK